MTGVIEGYLLIWKWNFFSSCAIDSSAYMVIVRDAMDNKNDPAVAKLH